MNTPNNQPQMRPLPSKYKPVLENVNQFFEDNGVHIEETIDTINKWQLRKPDSDEKYGAIRFYTADPVTIDTSSFIRGTTDKTLYIDLIVKQNGVKGTGKMLLLKLALWAYENKYTYIMLKAESNVGNNGRNVSEIDNLLHYYRNIGFECSYIPENRDCYAEPEMILDKAI